MGLGLVMVWSALSVRQVRLEGGGALMQPLFSHLLKALMALLGFLLAQRLGARQLFAAAGPAWIAGMVLLVAVLLLGVERNGSRRWFDLGGISLQPSEFARLATIALLGAWMAVSGDKVQNIKHGVLLPFSLAALPAALILVEPDFGSAVYLLLMAVLVLWVGGARSRHLMLVFLPSLLLAAGFAWAFLAHFRTRILNFLEPGTDYQVQQGLSALGSGGLFGAGLGNGVGKWGFLPEAEDDFLFAVIGEELGLLGAALVILLYALFLWHGVRILFSLKSRFSLVVGTGLLLQVVVQAVLNIAVVTAMAPNKGLPLPFLSAGGSSLLVLCISTGLLLGLARRPEEDPALEARWPVSLMARDRSAA